MVAALAAPMASLKSASWRFSSSFFKGRRLSSSFGGANRILPEPLFLASACSMQNSLRLSCLSASGAHGTGSTEPYLLQGFDLVHMVSTVCAAQACQESLGGRLGQTRLQVGRQREGQVRVPSRRRQRRRNRHREGIAQPELCSWGAAQGREAAWRGGRGY